MNAADRSTGKPAELVEPSVKRLEEAGTRRMGAISARGPASVTARPELPPCRVVASLMPNKLRPRTAATRVR